MALKLLELKDYLFKLGTARVTARLEEVTRVIDASDLNTASKHQVERHDEHRVEDDGAEHEGVVAIEGAVHEFAPDARDLENRLDHERAREDAGDGGPEVGYDGQEPAAQRVAGDDAPFRGALGAGGADEVLPEDLEHAAAGEAGEVGGGDEAEGESGENNIERGTPAGHFEDGYMEGEGDL